MPLTHMLPMYLSSRILCVMNSFIMEYIINKRVRICICIYFSDKQQHLFYCLCTWRAMSVIDSHTYTCGLVYALSLIPDQSSPVPKSSSSPSSRSRERRSSSSSSASSCRAIISSRLTTIIFGIESGARRPTSVKAPAACKNLTDAGTGVETPAASLSMKYCRRRIGGTIPQKVVISMQQKPLPPVSGGIKLSKHASSQQQSDG